MNPINYGEQIRQVLQISPTDYRKKQRLEFENWAEIQAKKFGIIGRDLTEIRFLWGYYQTLWNAQLERPMVADWGVFFQVMTPSDMQWHLRAYAQRLCQFSPKTILKEIRKKQQNNEKNICEPQLA